MNVFFRFPWTLLEIRIQIAVPVFSALLSIPEDLVFSVVEEVKPLGYHFPIFSIFTFPLETLVSHQPGQQVAFFFRPIICGEVDFF